MDLIDIFRTFDPKVEEYTLFSRENGTFSRIDHIRGHKSNFSKFKKIEIMSTILISIISSIGQQCCETRYQLHEKKPVRNTNTWRLNNTFLNNQKVTEEIKREIKIF